MRKVKKMRASRVNCFPVVLGIAFVWCVFVGIWVHFGSVMDGLQLRYMLPYTIRWHLRVNGTYFTWLRSSSSSSASSHKCFSRSRLESTRAHAFNGFIAFGACVCVVAARARLRRYVRSLHVRCSLCARGFVCVCDNKVCFYCGVKEEEEEEEDETTSPLESKFMCPYVRHINT